MCGDCPATRVQRDCSRDYPRFVLLLTSSSHASSGSNLLVRSAPRGTRTPNRQIRSHRPPVPSRPPYPRACPSSQLNGHVAGRSRASVPCRPAPHGRKLIAVSGSSLPDPMSGNGLVRGLWDASKILQHQIFNLVPQWLRYSRKAIATSISNSMPSAASRLKAANRKDDITRHPVMPGHDQVQRGQPLPDGELITSTFPPVRRLIRTRTPMR